MAPEPGQAPGPGPGATLDGYSPLQRYQPCWLDDQELAGRYGGGTANDDSKGSPAC